ncbi:MAG: phytoene desaturase family protein [Candidatus Hodarchaeales archaeon]
MSLKKNKTNKNDVVIIGAGIGGLVCGCYLANAGLRVLIIEKNTQPGGYCASFMRGRFKFDACVHSFGSCAPHELLGEIIRELKLNVKMIRANPSDIVITTDYKIEISNKMGETINQLCGFFPKEKKIINFFSLFEKPGLQLYYYLRKKTFKNLLDEYFKDLRIKAILSIFLANCGISPSKASAFSTMLFLKSFVFNGGYYPVGGMQKFTNSLVNSFLNAGGKIIYKQEVKKINTVNKVVKNVVLNNGEKIFSRIIASNTDSRCTFLQLIGEKKVNSQFILQITKLLPSSSAFIVYLGLKNIGQKIFKNSLGIWKMPDDYNIEKTLDLPLRNMISKDNFIFCSAPPNLNYSIDRNEKQTIRLIVNAPFKEKEYWDRNKNIYSEELINRANSLFPNMKEHIIYKESATPQTLYSYTHNFRGAMCGLLNIESQNENSLMKNFGIKNLYLVGHWLPERYGHGGIAMVAYSGKKVANKILFDLGKNKNN